MFLKGFCDGYAMIWMTCDARPVVQVLGIKKCINAKLESTGHIDEKIIVTQDKKLDLNGLARAYEKGLLIDKPSIPKIRFKKDDIKNIMKLPSSNETEQWIFGDS